MKKLKKVVCMASVLFLATMSFCFSQKNKIKLIITYNKPDIYKPQNVEVRWKTENAKVVRIEGIDKDLPTEGSMQLAFDERNFYKISAIKDKKNILKRNIAPRFLKIAINKFDLQDTLLEEGKKTYLRWEV
jgi:hypothetical protein